MGAVRRGCSGLAILGPLRGPFATQGRLPQCPRCAGRQRRDAEVLPGLPGSCGSRPCVAKRGRSPRRCAVLSGYAMAGGDSSVVTGWPAKGSMVAAEREVRRPCPRAPRPDRSLLASGCHGPATLSLRHFPGNAQGSQRTVGNIRRRSTMDCLDAQGRIRWQVGAPNRSSHRYSASLRSPLYLYSPLGTAPAWERRCTCGSWLASEEASPANLTHERSGSSPAAWPGTSRHPPGRTGRRGLHPRLPGRSIPGSR